MGFSPPRKPLYAPNYVYFGYSSAKFHNKPVTKIEKNIKSLRTKFSYSEKSPAGEINKVKLYFVSCEGLSINNIIREGGRGLSRIS